MQVPQSHLTWHPRPFRIHCNALCPLCIASAASRPFTFVIAIKQHRTASTRLRCPAVSAATPSHASRTARKNSSVGAAPARRRLPRQRKMETVARSMARPHAATQESDVVAAGAPSPAATVETPALATRMMTNSTARAFSSSIFSNSSVAGVAERCRVMAQDTLRHAQLVVLS